MEQIFFVVRQLTLVVYKQVYLRSYLLSML